MKLTADTCSIQRSDRPAPRSGSVVLLSACQVDQKSADTSVDGRPTGALTYAFCETLRRNPRLTYLALVKAMRSFMVQNLPSSFRQTPQLSFSTPGACTSAFRIGAAPRMVLPVVAVRGLEPSEAVLEDGPSFWL